MHNIDLLKEQHLVGNGRLTEFAMGHYYYGLHRNSDGWVFREWAPNAENIFLTGIFSGWKEKPEFNYSQIFTFNFKKPHLKLIKALIK